MNRLATMIEGEVFTIHLLSNSTFHYEVVHAGQVLKGVVTIAESYGAYVRHEDIEYFVPFHELSWSTLQLATDAVSVGDEVSFIVDRPVGQEPIIPLASIRRANPEANPWRQIALALNPGDSVKGVVVLVRPFGAFIDIGYGEVTALLLIADTNDQSPVRVGDRVTAYIRHISWISRKIALTQIKPQSPTEDGHRPI